MICTCVSQGRRQSVRVVVYLEFSCQELCQFILFVADVDIEVTHQSDRHIELYF
jgi:hypothetical protein